MSCRLARRLCEEAKTVQVSAEADLKSEKTQYKTTKETLAGVQQRRTQMKGNGTSKDVVEQLRRDSQESSDSLAGVKSELRQVVGKKEELKKDLEEVRAQKFARDETE